MVVHALVQLQPLNQTQKLGGPEGPSRLPCQPPETSRSPCGNPSNILPACSFRNGGHGGRRGGGGRAAAVPFLLGAVEPPATLGGPVRPRRQPVSPHGAGLPRPQGAPAAVPRLCCLLLLAPAPLHRRRPRLRPVPQLQGVPAARRVRYLLRRSIRKEDPVGDRVSLRLY